jgi:hypothetical protein
MSDRGYVAHRGGQDVPPFPPRVRPFGHRLYGRLTLVLSPLLVMVNVPEVVEA